MKIKSADFNISKDTKKRALSVFLIVLAVSVLCEIFLFNFKFWHSIGDTPLNVTPTVVNGATQLDENRYRIYKRNAYIEYENISSTVKYLRISPETGYDTSVTVLATDEGNEYPYSLPSRTVNTYVPRSQYIRLHLSGEADTVKIELNNTAGTIINLSDIVLNAHVPMMFSAERVAMLTLFAMLIYLLRPTSSIYKIKTDLTRKKQRIAVIAVAILQICVFANQSTVNHDALKWDETEVHHRQYYNLIDAFKSGKLSIGDGSDSLNAMENPYDYGARLENEVEFNWDNAYYNGSYYSYFGVLPAVLMYLPYNLITGGDLPNHTAVVILASFVIIGIMCLLWEIIKKWYKRTPFIVYLLMSTVFSAVSSLFYAVYKPDFYMVPPLAGLALSLFGISLWIGAENKNGTLKSGRVLWGAFLIALTSMCRPQFLIATFFGVIVFWKNVFKSRTLFSKSSLKQTLALCVPFILVAAVAMWYNLARFGSPFDFGANYNLTTNDMTKRGMVLGRTGLGLFTYFLQPMRIDAQFPFLNDFFPSTVYQGITISEKQMGGAFMMFPILIFAIVGIFKKKLFKKNTPYALVCFSVLAAVLVAALDTQMAGILMRYFTDFVWLLMIAASVSLFAMYDDYIRDGSRVRVRRLRLAVVVLAAISLTVAFLSIYTHSKNAVWWSNSIGYSHLKHLIGFWL